MMLATGCASDDATPRQQANDHARLLSTNRPAQHSNMNQSSSTSTDRGYSTGIRQQANEDIQIRIVGRTQYGTGTGTGYGTGGGYANPGSVNWTGQAPTGAPNGSNYGTQAPTGGYWGQTPAGNRTTTTTQPNTNRQPAAQKPVTQQPATQQPAAGSSVAQQVLDLVNQERAKAGLSALTMNAELSKVAMAKAKDMYDNNYFAHQSPTYGSPFDMMKSFGIKYNVAGENIAKGQRTAADVMKDWMNSPGHRANILKDGFKQIGIAYYNGEWVQQFIG